MSETYYFKPKKKELSNGVYIFLLFLSFVWISIYPAVNSFSYSFTLGFGNLLDMSNPNASYIAFMMLFVALMGLLVFELALFVYRFIINFKIYSFLVPVRRLKAESRMFFAYRNLIFGIFMNLCFFLPYLYSFMTLIDIVTSFSMLLLYVNRINKRYAEPIVRHFVFKCFSYPIFFYEALVLLFTVFGWV